MSQRLTDIVDKVLKARQRQFDLPGSEWDAHNSPGDWTSLISHYVTKEVRVNGVAPLADDFEDALIKAAALILAALEHKQNMLDRNQLL